MPTLSYIKIIKEKHLLRLGISEGEECAAYTVTERAFCDIGKPSRGEELDGDTVGAIKLCDEYIRAKRKALSLLSYADNSERGLVLKLRRAGFAREISEEVSREMVSLGYINEDRSLERLLLSEANLKLRGPSKLIPCAVSRGYSPADAKRVLSRLVESGEVDLRRNADALVKRKLGDAPDPEERRALLYKNGYKIRD